MPPQVLRSVAMGPSILKFSYIETAGQAQKPSPIKNGAVARAM